MLHRISILEGYIDKTGDDGSYQREIDEIKEELRQFTPERSGN
jgi:hypothetical protein